jgi:nitrile hydratase subunit beta
VIESLFSKVVTATGEKHAFDVGESVRVGNLVPIGHYRVPTYLRGKVGRVIKVIEPSLIDNEEEGYGRNAGNRRHYYRVSVLMTQIWSDYEGSPRDELQIEVYETWLERLP